MSLTNPVLCSSGVFSLYRVVLFFIFCICCHRTNQIRSMMSLMMMGLNPDPLVRTLFGIFIFILIIPLVVLVVWGQAFLHQQDSSPKVIFLSLTCLYQQDLSPKVVDSSEYFGAQIPYFLSKLETQFYRFSRSQTLTPSLQPLYFHQKYD